MGRLLFPLLDTTVGVFHVRSPLGQYKLTFDTARATCASEAATVATYNQLSYAQKVGPGETASTGRGCHLLRRGSSGLLALEGQIQEAPGAMDDSLCPVSSIHVYQALALSASLTLLSIRTTPCKMFYR